MKDLVHARALDHLARLRLGHVAERIDAMLSDAANKDVTCLPFEKRAAHLFFQLVARRYERGSLLITTNQVVSQWGAVFGDDVLAAAILDRLLHHSHTLMIQGESYRLKQKKKVGLLGSSSVSKA